MPRMWEKKTAAIQLYLVKAYKQGSAYAWYNTEETYRHKNPVKLWTTDCTEEMQDLVNRHDKIKQLIIVKNIDPSRPQRTGGDIMPEWFRPTIYHNYEGYFHDNTFIFAMFEDFEEEEIEAAIESFPYRNKVIRIKKEEK